MPRVRILEEYCKGCELCVSVCPKQSLELSHRVNKRGLHVVCVVKAFACTGCGNCALMCPDAAIEIIDEDGNEKTASTKSEGKNNEG